MGLFLLTVLFLHTFSVPPFWPVPAPASVDALSCYACQFAYTNSLSAATLEDAWCGNDTLVRGGGRTCSEGIGSFSVDVSEREVIRPCALWEKFCSTTIVTMLNSLTSISRQCLERCGKGDSDGPPDPPNSGSRGCEASGYGQDHVSCTDCCEVDKCNNNHTLDYYIEVMAQQYTSWTRPVKNERQFNQKHNLRFPY